MHTDFQELLFGEYAFKNVEFKYTIFDIEQKV